MAIVHGLEEVILYVENMNGQVAFYRDVLGLPVVEPQNAESFDQVYWVELAAGPCRLALHGGGQCRFGPDAPKLVFGVPHVAAAREALIARGVSMGEVRSPAPGVEVCDGIDPEGNKFSIESRD
jgi:catechol 2,3-dioxygenase-like lactoylglutathione lyase family enzyme